ncbi:hypothetical protein IP88_03425 [alpha proteobacterium AAP81b]|nr:hypothetical protein IP88_03425 [alpha proteobacterium AAP81b]
MTMLRHAQRFLRTPLPAAALALLPLAMPAAAQEAAPAAPAPAATAPSDSAMVNLVRALVAQKAITEAQGNALIAQAEAEAAAARAAREAAPAGIAAAPPGTIRVPYVPDTVRTQIKEELKREVLAEAKAERWAAPDAAAPEWTQRITIGGDLRVRYYGEYYSNQNSNQIIDFEQINLQGPYDVFNNPVLPFLNSRQNRNTADFRLRLNIGAKITDRLAVDLQLATGDDRSPISVSDSLGGGLRPRNFWVQRAAIIAKPTDWSRVWAGRFTNPFTSAALTTERVTLLFDNDLAFDGIAAEANIGKALGQDFNATVRGGLFPIDLGGRNYPSTSQDKIAYPAKYFYSGQLELEHKFGGVDVQASIAYHDFKNIQGQLSEPCLVYLGAVECSTDGFRPNFQRKGNTLSPLRRIAVDPTLPSGQVQPQPQFFAPTFGFRVLHLSAEANVPVWDKTFVKVTGQYINNLAFKRSDICRNGIAGQPFNNGGDGGDGNICSATNATPFVGGNQGYQIGLALGTAKIKTRGDWSLNLGYRYLESDAILDSLTDSDFHLGGTNNKGFIVGAEVGIAKNLVVGGRWLSANEIAGEPYAIDVLQIEMVASF